MLDLFPDNARRFKMTYDDLLSMHGLTGEPV